MNENKEKEQKSNEKKEEFKDEDIKKKSEVSDASSEKKKSSDVKNKSSEELEKTKKELDETKQKYLLMLAEYDNFRKRSQKERESAYTDAYSDAIKTLLPVFDNIERANTFADSKGIAEGLEMILNQFSTALTSLGIEEFGKIGEQFDPNMHNAIMHITDENLGENVIAEVLQKGYKRGDKIIRFAMVKVANCG